MLAFVEVVFSLWVKFDVLFEVVTWLLNPFLLAEIVEVVFFHTKACILRLSRVPNQHSMDICAFV